jgi:hypothetical protein
MESSFFMSSFFMLLSFFIASFLAFLVFLLSSFFIESFFIESSFIESSFFIESCLVSSCFIESWLVDWAKAAIETAKVQTSVKLLNIFFMVFSLEVSIEFGHPAGWTCGLRWDEPARWKVTTGRTNNQSWRHPQWLKPEDFTASDGTAKAVPFPILAQAALLEAAPFQSKVAPSSELSAG